MESKLTRKASMVVSLISIIAYSLLANSYYYLTHSTDGQGSVGVVQREVGAADTVCARPAPTPQPSLTPRLSLTLTPTPIPTPTPALICKWIVAPNGSSSGNGSTSKPWSLKTLFGGNPAFDGVGPPSAIKPGSTVCLREGTYQGVFKTVLAGTKSTPITIQPYPGEYVKIDTDAIPDQSIDPSDRSDTIIITGGGYLILRDL